MKFSIFLFPLFAISLNAFCQLSDTILWSPSYKITWNDFKGTPDNISKYVAVSYPGIKYFLSADPDTFHISVLCYFLKSKSWTKARDNDILLLHEQGHFDIAELFARKLRKAFFDYKFSYQTVGKDIDALFTNNKQDRIKMDLLYDNETNLSQNRNRQLIWNSRIKIELNKLRKFAST